MVAIPSVKNGRLLTNIRPLYDAPCHHVLQLLMRMTCIQNTITTVHRNVFDIFDENQRPIHPKSAIGVQRKRPLFGEKST
jgi:hypothetical protein